MKRTRYLVALLLAALILYGGAALLDVTRQLRQAETLLQELKTEEAALTQSNAELRYAMEHAGQPEIIAEIARDKLGLVMPGETIYFDAGN